MCMRSLQETASRSVALCAMQAVLMQQAAAELAACMVYLQLLQLSYGRI